MPPGNKKKGGGKDERSEIECTYRFQRLDGTDGIFSNEFSYLLIFSRNNIFHFVFFILFVSSSIFRFYFSFILDEMESNFLKPS